MGLNAMPCSTSLTVRLTVSISIELPLTSHRPLDRNPDVVGLADLFVSGAAELVYVVGLGDVERPALSRVPQLGVLRSRGWLLHHSVCGCSGATGQM